MPIIVSLEEFAVAQLEDEELKTLLSEQSALKLQKFILSGSSTPIYCDCSTECISLHSSTTSKTNF